MGGGGGCFAIAERCDGAGAADRDELRGQRARGGRGQAVTAQASRSCHDPGRGDVGVPQARHQVGGRAGGEFFFVFSLAWYCRAGVDEWRMKLSVE